MLLKSFWVGLGVLVCVFSLAYAGEKKKTYVGSKVCAECHQQEYENWNRYSEMSHAFESVMRMKHDLTPEELKGCYKCHTTGYGEPTGFKDPVTTPDLKEVGCEACHGPGSVHVQTNDPADIKTNITTKDCKRCHNTAREKAFGFKPLIHAGAH